MIRPDRIKSEIFGGVGWRQTTLSGYPVIASPNTNASSGLYFQDGTSFVTIQNIYDCQQDSKISDPNFNTYLTQLQESCILEVCQKINNKESDFIQSTNLYPYEKSFSNTIEHSEKFVGFQIDRKKQINILGKINWIELTFDSVATFNIYLYNSNLPKTAIKTVSVTTVANESVIVSLNDWEIADNETFKGGTFYWGYFENDLNGAKAIKKDYELADLQVSTKCHYVTPISMDHSGLIIDITTVEEKSETYGLNFCIDTYNDYTELFIRNKNILFQAIQYQMAERVLNLVRTSIRSNVIERLNKDNINFIDFELYGNKEAGIVGITGKLNRVIDDIRKMFFYKSLISRRTLH